MAGPTLSKSISFINDRIFSCAFSNSRGSIAAGCTANALQAVGSNSGVALPPPSPNPIVQFPSLALDWGSTSATNLDLTLYLNNSNVQVHTCGL